MASRVVVTGASGMLGGAVVRELNERGEDARGWSYGIPRSPDGIEFQQIDLRSERADMALRSARVDLVIHCAALTDADLCERCPEVAKEVNSLVPERLARIACLLGSRFVHVSTDAVYDGRRPSGRHKESELPFPESIYAKTKLEGEGRVLAAYPEALVVRTTMFGWTIPDAPRPKFAEQILGALTGRMEIPLFRDAIFSPLHVGNLASTLLDLANTDESGVLNVGSRDPISKADFGRLVANIFGLDPSFIREASVDDANLLAQRTKNTGLDVSRFRRLLGEEPPTVSDGVVRLYEEAFDGTAEKIRGRKEYP